MFAEVFVRVFCPGWFLSVPPSVTIHLLQQKVKITLNFMFHMYDKNLYKRDVTCSTPSSVTNCHTFSDPLSPSSVTYFMDGPTIHIYIHTSIHTYKQTYTHTYIHTYIHTYVRTYIHTYIHTRTSYSSDV